jgi:hypothetical protein
VSVRVGEETAWSIVARADLATALAELADRPARWPGIGVRAAGPVRLVLVADARALSALTRGRAPSWGAGVTLPTGRLILLRTDLPDLPGTLRHELAHVVLHETVHTRVPLWFDEGYATVASDGFGLSDRLELHLAVALGGVPTFGDLDGELRGTEPSAARAYGLAASAVLGLARRIPGGDLSPLLTELAAGVGFDSAVHQVTGRTLPQFEYDWRRETRRRYGGITGAAGAGFWLVLGVLVLALGVRKRRLEAPRRAALDEGWAVPEEGQEPGPLDHDGVNG